MDQPVRDVTNPLPEQFPPNNNTHKKTVQEFTAREHARSLERHAGHVLFADSSLVEAASDNPLVTHSSLLKFLR